MFKLYQGLTIPSQASGLSRTHSQSGPIFASWMVWKFHACWPHEVFSAPIVIWLCLKNRAFNGLVEGKIYRKPWFLPSNIRLSCKFSHHPILWGIQKIQYRNCLLFQVIPGAHHFQTPSFIIVSWWALSHYIPILYPDYIPTISHLHPSPFSMVRPPFSMLEIPIFDGDISIFSGETRHIPSNLNRWTVP